MIKKIAIVVGLLAVIGFAANAFADYTVVTCKPQTGIGEINQGYFTISVGQGAIQTFHQSCAQVLSMVKSTDIPLGNPVATGSTAIYAFVNS